MNDTEIIRQYYDTSVQYEWERLERYPFEFAITKHYLDRYVQPGMRVLDIGGGPGRYALHLAEKGCDVTLLDLSGENVRFAREKATELGVTLKTVHGDARNADTLVTESFNCALLMGPMYHLLHEEERKEAVTVALKLLAPGGLLLVSFLTLNGGLGYYMDLGPALVVEEGEQKFVRCFVENRTYNGDAFTRACFIAVKEILPFMGHFPLRKLHLIGQEGITPPIHSKLMASEAPVLERWTEIALQTCEREELLAYSSHLLYIGQRND